MLACLDKNQSRPVLLSPSKQTIPQDTLWLDLLFPSRTEELAVERFLALDIPTRADMIEIEQSSRLYEKDGVLFMTAVMIASSESLDPLFDPVTFILTPTILITIRYIEPQAFKLFTEHLPKSEYRDGKTVFIELLEATIDRLADTLELVGHRLEDYSRSIFKAPHVKHNYQLSLQELGSSGDLNTKASESLVTFKRLIVYFLKMSPQELKDDQRARLMSMIKDISSLIDHTYIISTKTNFLLDATLGLISIEQNNIIKIFSVAAVIFLPPTLIASIYGMNFHHIPGLSWKYGYYTSLGLIVVAAWLPYKYFKYKKWL